MSRRKNNDDADPTRPLPPEDVDALLAESLKAQTERDFTWKEPERKPRWWERQQIQQAQTAGPVSAYPREEGRGVRLGSVIFGAVCLILALWVLATVVFGLTVEPIVLALVICSLAGLTLVIAGLRPKPGARI